MADEDPAPPLPLDPREESGEAVVLRAARNATLTATAQIIGKFSSLAWMLLAARQLGPSGFGLFVLALAIAQLTSVFCEWGFDSVLVHRGSQDPSRLPTFLTAALVWETALAVPVFAVTWFWATHTHGGGAVFASTLALVLVSQHLEICSDTVRGAAAAVQRVAGTSIALVVQRLVTSAAAIAALVAGAGPRGLSAVVLLGAVVGLAGAALAGRRTGLRLGRVSRADLVDYERRARTVGVSAIVLMALFRADVILVSAFLGDRAVAAYAAAYRLFEATLFVVFSIRSAVFPAMSAAGDSLRIGRLYDQASAAGAVLYVPFAVLALTEAPWLLHLLYGREYAGPSTGSLRWLALAPLTYAAAYLASAALQAVGHARGMLPAAVAATVVNLGLNVVLIPVAGIAAAAAMTTICYLVQAVVALVILRRRGCRASPLASLRVPLAAGAAAAGVVVLAPLAQPVALVLAAVVYVVGVHVLGRREGETFNLARRLFRVG